MNQERTLTTGDRVKMRRTELNLSQDKLAQLSGLTQPTISGLEKNRAHTSGSLAAIADALGVRALWLASGLGEMLANGPQNAPANEDSYHIPLLDCRGSCGNGRNYGDIDTSPLTISKRLLARYHVSHVSKLISLHADGDSMMPFITHGDIMLFDTGITDFTDGRIYLIETMDGLRVKRIQRRADGRVVLRSDNPDKGRYPDEEYSRDHASDLAVKGQFMLRIGG